jgi:formylglycine-generating enzyme required for sulfatase activity
MSDDGYTRPGLWLSDGWETVKQSGCEAPLYWERDPGDATGWRVFTLRGWHGLADLLDTAVCHISFFEADAFARWRACWLPTEAEWESVASQEPWDGNLLDRGRLHPARANASGAIEQLFRDCWEWTASPYTGYPGYKPLPGALGEYNGKFMSGQIILRGGGRASRRRIMCAQLIAIFFPGNTMAIHRNTFSKLKDFPRMTTLSPAFEPERAPAFSSTRKTNPSNTERIGVLIRMRSKEHV